MIEHDKPVSIQMHIHMSADIFHQVIARWGVSGWNHWQSSIAGWMPDHWSGDACPPPFCAFFSFDNMTVTGRNLTGIDLSHASCRRATFNNCSLTGARFFECQNACFLGCNLTHASFRYAVISGTKLEDCELEGATFFKAVYDKRNPPVGLPGNLMQFCEPFEDDPPDDGSGGVTEYPIFIQASLVGLHS